ncbi:MAG TPA: hydrogenase assembly protein HupF [Pyrodictium sp.]|nr:hydrogenase assembly protein HupF [Pyrodictium sp.]HIQ55661.1 hydrogenase assembly protein HupF [Pyrodictium sp.]
MGECTVVGKLPPELMNIVFRFHGVDDPKVIVGPAIGEDAAVINLDGLYLVVHSDPITEAASRVGWLAVNVAANDVAVTGATPRWASIVILLPENGIGLLRPIVEDIDRAAKELGIAVVGGHTEEAPGVEKPTVIATVMGVTRRYVATSGARPGDVIIMVKHGALEGTAILAYDFEKMLLGRGIEREVIETAKKFLDEISVVKPALLISDITDAMHDPTEGGILGALYEIAHASQTRIAVYKDKVIFRTETLKIAKTLKIDPLKLISSGTLLAAIPPDKVNEALHRLSSRGYPVAVIGKILEKSKSPCVEVYEGKKLVETVKGFVKDELARLWELAKPYPQD